jgi:hypothetical protein
MLADTTLSAHLGRVSVACFNQSSKSPIWTQSSTSHRRTFEGQAQAHGQRFKRRPSHQKSTSNEEKLRY